MKRSNETWMGYEFYKEYRKVNEVLTGVYVVYSYGKEIGFDVNYSKAELLYLQYKLEKRGFSRI